MSAVRAGWRSWLLAGVGSVCVVGGVLALFRPPSSNEGAAKQQTLASAEKRSAVAPTVGPISLVPGAEGAADRLLKEEAQLRDPTPLFLPTAWNAGENALPTELQREPGSVFQGYAPRLTFAETDLRLGFPSVMQVPARPVEGLAADRPSRPYGGFGEMDATVPALAERSAYVEVLATGDGRVMLSEPLLSGGPPGERNWQPLEFLVAVDSMGLVRPAVLTESSRVAAVDSYFQEYLGKGLHIGERLPAGFYRICIGP